MTSSNTKTMSNHISAYGYGMMAMSTTIAVLLFNGFFQKLGPDLMAVWFVVALAAATGALAVALVRTNLPHLRKPVAMTYITLVFLIMLASYLTSFFGYSEAYVLYFLRPFPEHDFSFDKFMNGLEQVWLGVTLVSVACTAAYVLIHAITPSEKTTIVVDSPSDETEGLAE